MRKNTVLRKSCAFLCLVLIAAACMAVTGCKKVSKYEPGTTVAGGEYGEGEKTFSFRVTDGEGKDYEFVIHTDREKVGEALVDMGLVVGEAGAYGLYVKVVNGIVADYDADGTYWAFYINGEYAMTGVDQTSIEPDTLYQFKVEKM